MKPKYSFAHLAITGNVRWIGADSQSQSKDIWPRFQILILRMAFEMQSILFYSLYY